LAALAGAVLNAFDLARLQVSWLNASSAEIDEG
jgi:hypothetical protein